MRPVSSAPSQDSPRILLSDACQCKTYPVAMSISRSPVALHTYRYASTTTRPLKNLTNMREVKRYSMSLLLLRTAYSLLSLATGVLPEVKLRKRARQEQSTSLSLDAIGVLFAADVIKRSRQLVLVLGECMTSFTATRISDTTPYMKLLSAYVSKCFQWTTNRRTY